MKEFLECTYGLEIIGFIKITKKVYKIKCREGFLALKFVDDTKLTRIINHIDSLHLKCFVTVIKNKQNEIITNYQGQLFYLMTWLDSDKGIIKELKLKFYYECLAYLHNSSFFNYGVSKGFFTQQIADINKIIDERCSYYDELMCSFERQSYRSPTGWLFVMNYCRIAACLQQARKLLQEYQQYVEGLDNLRLCITYNNFNYNHLMMKENKFISLDYLQINLCIYDIYTMYQKIPEFLFDFDIILDSYLCQVKLQQEECLLLRCLLHVVPIIKLGYDEIDNIIVMARLLYYLDSISNLNKKLSLTS